MRYTEMLSDLQAKANDIHKAIAALEPLAAAEKDGRGQVSVPTATQARPTQPQQPAARRNARQTMSQAQRDILSRKMKLAWKKRKASGKGSPRKAAKKAARRHPNQRAMRQPSTIQVVRQGEQATRELQAHEPQEIITNTGEM